jgi:8-oxo-dGTP pyrophosphatase MutT (NUDIX family)
VEPVISEPRLATTLCVVIPADAGLRVLMVRRSPAMRFMPGAWVFPGGVIDPGDEDLADLIVPGAASDHRAWAAAGVRELLEETGIWLSDPPAVVPVADRHQATIAGLVADHGPVDGGAIRHLSTWITPTIVPVRFHTRFSLMAIDAAVTGEPDGAEVDAVDWVVPAAMIDRADAGDAALALPTRHTLAGFARLGSVDAVVEHAGSAPPPLMQPRLRLAGDVLVALLPGDDGYEEAPELPPDPGMLGRATEVRAADGAPVPELGPRR